MEPKFKTGDQVAFLWDSMDTHYGQVKEYHGAVESRPMYSVWDVTPGGLEVTRFLYEHEMTLAE